MYKARVVFHHLLLTYNTLALRFVTEIPRTIAHDRVLPHASGNDHCTYTRHTPKSPTTPSFLLCTNSLSQYNAPKTMNVH
uniref:Putative secreted peptide n=1 Tax=Anopheles braziliensis TaxID=58242 RepID=A0A2M3ZSV6_9DIPT